jgi:hypothetical protein
MGRADIGSRLHGVADNDRDPASGSLSAKRQLPFLATDGSSRAILRRSIVANAVVATVVIAFQHLSLPMESLTRVMKRAAAFTCLVDLPVDLLTDDARLGHRTCRNGGVVLRNLGASAHIQSPLAIRVTLWVLLPTPSLSPHQWRTGTWSLSSSDGKERSLMKGMCGRDGVAPANSFSSTGSPRGWTAVALLQFQLYNLVRI